MSIDNADVEGMRESAEQLDAGKYYGLMACMITGRSWQSITNGIYRTPRSESEVSTVNVWNPNFCAISFQTQKVSEILQKIVQILDIRSVWNLNCLETEQLLSVWNPY